MTPASPDTPGIGPRRALKAGIALAAGGVLVPAAASVDPWLLVLVAGLAGFAFTVRWPDLDLGD